MHNARKGFFFLKKKKKENVLVICFYKNCYKSNIPVFFFYKIRVDNVIFFYKKTQLIVVVINVRFLFFSTLSTTKWGIQILNF